jgi:CHAT domain-containing protein/tetratricopeptide (TPR) repeat protein
MQDRNIMKRAIIWIMTLCLFSATAVVADTMDDAKTLNAKVVELYQKGRYAEAIPYAQQSLAIREKALGPDHPAVAQSLSNLAFFYSNLGDYAKAEPLYKRSLAIYEKILGPDHPAVALSLNSMAVLYLNLGDYEKAEPLLRRSLAISEKAVGPDHPDVALILRNLAELYKTMGNYAKAEPLYKRSLAIVENALGPDHPHVATCLNSVAELYRELGDYAKAEPLLRRSLAIREKALGPDHPDVATSLNNMANLYRNLGNYWKAAPLYKRSLAIYEKILGPDHPHVAASLNNLASLYENLGDYGKAEPFFKRSLAIVEKALGPDHPHVATCLNNLAELYVNMEDYGKAESLHKRSLVIREKALGPDHPSVAESLSNLALLFGARGIYTESHKHFMRAISIDGKVRENAFLILSEKQKLSYVQKISGTLHTFLSLTVRYGQSDPQAVTDTLNAWIRWKGTVMEAQGRYLDAMMYSDNPQIKKMFDELVNLRREMAWLQISKPEKMSVEEYKKIRAELDMRKETLETELSRLSQDFNLERMVGKADATRISSILPKDSVYLDVARINIYDFTQKKYIGSHYLLFVLTTGKDASVKLIKIGKTEDVDKHVNAFLKEMNRIKTEGKLPDADILKKEGKAVYDLVLKPAEPFIGDRKHLFISPDGNLNLIPFEVMVTAKGKYLTEDCFVTYVGAGRDIVKFTDRTVAKGDALIMADPDYNIGLQEKQKLARQMGITETRIRGVISRDAVQMSFDRLPETKPEADAIEVILKKKLSLNVGNYQDKLALEEVLFNVRNPRILHLSTHGYFLNAEEVKHDANLRGVRITMKESPMQGDGATVPIENPMLRSGIVLAGVNTSLKEGRDDGMVSAEKILGLRLKGTDLVVLSACETGVGDVQMGEGVFGLKRAFILSGARSVVMSLWSVPSRETTELMTDFYTLISQGSSKSTALRQAKLNLMKKKSNPFYWGAFVMVGVP